MLPAPARIAAAPRPKSGASWNPAVPPPPVAGAAVTTGLADWLGVADPAAEGLALALGVVALAVLLGRLAGVVEAAPEGDNEVGVVDGKDCEGREPEQAETDKDASMVKVAQPTVSLALGLVPMMVVRIFMDLLMPPEDGGCVSRSRYRKGNRGPVRRVPGGPAAIKIKHIDGADMQWQVHHWNIRLRD
jgi:hypothetical protein